MDGQEALLEEQVAHYRAHAGDYLDGVRDVPGLTELEAALVAFRATGDVLELACGPATWTPILLRTASSVTAVDAAPEMLAIARSRVDDGRVRFLQSDLFAWRPTRTYDAVFFGFWLSHVPMQRFDDFWRTVAACLAPGGRVFFMDDANRTAEELVEGMSSSTVVRTTAAGEKHRIVKVPHSAVALQDRLRELDWDISVTSTGGGLYWGSGRRGGVLREA